MPVGKVKWFSAKKGYGFITGEDGQEVFVHYTDIVGTGRRTLKGGEKVRYEVAQDGSSLRAVTVVRAGAEKDRGSNKSPGA